MLLIGRIVVGAGLLVVMALAGCVGDRDDDGVPTPTAGQAGSTATPETPTAPAAATPTPASEEATPDYELMAIWGGPAIPQFPYDVALLDDGRIAVADLGLDQIQIYHQDGSLETSWSASEPLAGDESGPSWAHRVVPANDSLYVAFARGPSLARFDLDGNLLAGHFFESSNQAIGDLAAGPDGRIYIVSGDRRNPAAANRPPYGVLVFDAELNLLVTWEAPEGVAPLALDFDAEGVANILLYHYAGVGEQAVPIQPARIARIDPASYTPDGETAVIWPSGTNTHSATHRVAAGPDGVFAIVTASIDGRPVFAIKRVDESEKVIAIFHSDPEAELPSSEAIRAWPYDFAVASDGSFYVIDGLAQAVVRVGPDGRETGRWEVEDGAGRFLQAIDVDDEGRIYLVDARHREILVYEPTGE